jgi:hypothetical protein
MSTSPVGFGTDPRIARATVRALDRIADVFPEVLTLRDGKMFALQRHIEVALQEALSIRTVKGKPKHNGG